MPTDLVSQLLDIAPQIALGILFVIALAILLREYRSLRTDIKATVDDAVNARLGALLGTLQIEAASATRVLTEMTTRDEQIRKVAHEFEAKLVGHQERLDRASAHISERLEILGRQADALADVSPSDLVILAEHLESGDAETMLRSVLEASDATAGDLANAGSVAYKRRRLQLALSLYSRAVERDPENSWARLQLLCLTAEMDAARRDAAIEEASAIVLQTPRYNFETRLANTLFYLERYEQLAMLCRQMLALDLPPRIRAQALRDLGVALRNMGDFTKAKECLEEALTAEPDDENIIKAFLAILRATNEHDRLLEFAQRLLLLDPLDAYYYSLMAEAYTALNRIDEAIAWHERAVEMMAEEGRKEVERRKIRLLKTRLQLMGEFDGQGRGDDPLPLQDDGVTTVSLDP